MPLRPLLALAALVVAATCNASDGPPPRAYDLGVEAYRAEDYALARKHWAKAVEEGERRALNNLGYLLYYALGGPPDRPRAISLWRRGARLGHSEAQRHLGRAYEDGTDLSRNFVEAFAWYRCAIASAEAAPEHEKALESSIAADATKSLESLKARLTPKQVELGESLARKHIERFARRKAGA